MGTKVKGFVLYLYPVVRGMPPFFQIMCGLGLPPTWHSNTTLPPSTSFWTLGFLMKNGAADVLSVSTSTLPGHFKFRAGTNFKQVASGNIFNWKCGLRLPVIVPES